MSILDRGFDPSFFFDRRRPSRVADPSCPSHPEADLTPVLRLPAVVYFRCSACAQIIAIEKPLGAGRVIPAAHRSW